MARDIELKKNYIVVAVLFGYHFYGPETNQKTKPKNKIENTIDAVQLTNRRRRSLLPLMSLFLFISLIK